MDIQVFFASNAFRMFGSRFVGRPLALSGSGTKCGCSDASHLCCSASAAVGRDAGSIVRHADTNSRAVSDTFAQYSAVFSWFDQVRDDEVRADGVKEEDAHQARSGSRLR